VWQWHRPVYPKPDFRGPLSYYAGPDGFSRRLFRTPRRIRFKVIISASRRTDIPAFYLPWLLGRIEEGFCLVANPFRPSQISRVSLLPEAVTAWVFWSKNPRPMLTELNRFDRRGYRYYFLITLNDYPHELEPNLPPLAQRVDTFIRLSERLGPRRVIWRYDPIVFSNLTPTSFHQSRFEGLCRALGGHTERVVISVVDFYKKTERRLGELERQGLEVERASGTHEKAVALLVRLKQIAESYRISLRSCAEDESFEDVGIAPGACIDGELIDELGRSDRDPVPAGADRGVALVAKDSGQRARCQCIQSKDIGAPDTCLHGCRYCYATCSDALAQKRYAAHDPQSPILFQPLKKPF
jgi:hypothetical protein